jgi:thioredoxin 1
MGQVKKITDETFEADILKSDTPVLLDFWAEWCGPCRQLAPILDQLAEEVGSKVVIAKMNIDESPETPSKYGVRGIPTMMLFKNGEAKATKVGALPKTQLKDWLESQLEN